MLKSLASISLLAAASIQSVAGQNTLQSYVASGIANVLLNLQGTQVIPDLLPASQYNLSALLMQTFGSTSNTPGQMLSINQVADEPSFSLQYSSNQASTFTNQSFTIMTLDPGAATSTTNNVVRHFLANNVALTNGQLTNTTENIAGWFSPAPPAGDGVHRYTTLVFAQPSNFGLTTALSTPNATIDTDFDVSSYIKQTNLGSIVAATFFLCQNASTAASSSVNPISTSTIGSAMISSASASASSSLAALYGSATATSMGTSGATPSIPFFQSAYIASFVACIFAGAAYLL